ncbi:MAG: NuoM family protein, partial [Flavobacteriales bacterium]
MITLSLIIIPLFFSLILFVSKSPKAKQLAMLAALLELAVGLTAFWMQQHGSSDMLSFVKDWNGPLGMTCAFQLDGISAVMILLTAIVFPLVVYSSFAEEQRNPSVYYGLMLAMVASMVGAFTTSDAILFYAFYEFALIPVFFMILNWSKAADIRAIVTKFFLYTLFGSLFMLVSLLYVYQHAGSFDMQKMIAAGRALSGVEQGWVFAGFFIAFAVKIPVFPFHSWQPSTYDAAPTSATMLLGGIMLKMASYGLIRLVLPMVPSGVADYGSWALALSAFSVLYASWMAISQKRMKLLLAWSSVAHLGVLSAGILSGTVQGVQGGVFEMFSHGVLTVGLFFVYDIIQRRMGTDEFAKLGGIREVNPLFAFLFFALVMGSVALPFTSGFVGEFNMLMGLYQVSPVWTAIAGLTVVLGAVYMLRAFQTSMLGSAGSVTQSFAALSNQEKLVLYLVVALVVGLGIYPQVVLSASADAVNSI